MTGEVKRHREQVAQVPERPEAREALDVKVARALKGFRGGSGTSAGAASVTCTAASAGSASVAVRAGVTSAARRSTGKQQPALAEVPSPQQSVHSVPRDTERRVPGEVEVVGEGTATAG